MNIEPQVYVSSVEGKVVPRYGAKGFFHGCTRTPEGFSWDTETIEMIPQSMFDKYQLEYRRALNSNESGGSALIQRTAEEYEQQQAPAPKKSAKRDKE